VKTVLFPYKTLSTDPVLTLSNPRVDAEPVQLLTREGHIDLFAAPEGWRQARIGLRVQLPIDELASIGASEPEVVATLNCGPTNLRVAQRLEPGARAGQWVGEFDLPRTLLVDRAELYATVAGTVAGEPHRWLGRTRPVQVDVAPPRSPEFGPAGQIPVVWRDFATTEEGQNPIDPALHNEIAYVDLAGAAGPVIYLNDGIDGLRRLLDDRTGRSPVERATREVVFDLIAQSALVAMFTAAVAAAAELAEDGEAQMPSHDWQRGVLESLLPLMYPDRDVEAALAIAAEALDSGDDAQDVQTRLLGAAARHVRTRTHVLQTMTALENQQPQEA
jgi:hypothetical protein